jgi:hypothetical protein
VLRGSDLHDSRIRSPLLHPALRRKFISEADVRKTAFSRSSSFHMERYWLASQPTFDAPSATIPEFADQSSSSPRLLMAPIPDRAPQERAIMEVLHGSATYRSELRARSGSLNRNCRLNVALIYILSMGTFISELPKGVREQD